MGHTLEIRVSVLLDSEGQADPKGHGEGTARAGRLSVHAEVHRASCALGYAGLLWLGGRALLARVQWHRENPACSSALGHLELEPSSAQTEPTQHGLGTFPHRVAVSLPANSTGTGRLRVPSTQLRAGAGQRLGPVSSRSQPNHFCR